MYSFVICTKNEAENIAAVLKAIPEGYEIIVVDKSEDDTAKIAKNLGAKVIRQRKSGKGNAMKLGVKRARGEFIVFVDGDDSYDLSKINEILKKAKRYDIFYCWRKMPIFPFWRWFGNKIFTFIANVLHGETPDLLTGFFVIRKDVFSSLKLEEEGFGIETEIFVKAQRKNLKIGGCFVNYRPRKKSNLNMIRDGLRILRILLGI